MLKNAGRKKLTTLRELVKELALSGVTKEEIEKAVEDGLSIPVEN